MFMDSKFTITAQYKEGTIEAYDRGEILSEDCYADTQDEVSALMKDYLDDENVVTITIRRNINKKEQA